MAAKKFLSYQGQIDKLNNEKGFLVKGKVSREYLVRNGYFNLINGYKDFFCSTKSGCRVYYNKIKVDELKNVMVFDKNLRKIIFRYVTQVEEEVGAIFGYIFEKDLFQKKFNWGDMALYSNSAGKSGRNILSRIYSDISKRSNDYLRHYENKHSYLPTWIMIKALTFGTLIKLIKNTDEIYKKELCDLYDISYKNGDYRKLTTMLSLINALRNNIAHSERIIDFKGNSNNKRSFTKYHKIFGYNTIKQEKLIDVLLYLKMFIPGKEFKTLINEILNEFHTLKAHIHNNAFIKISSTIGLKTRVDYKNALEEIKSNSQIINYSALI